MLIGSLLHLLDVIQEDKASTQIKKPPLKFFFLTIFALAFMLEFHP
jgi:hypothetical protein